MGGSKNDNGKLRMDLIPYEVEEALATVLTHGAQKYGDNNWREGINYSRIYGAMRRHLLAWRKGEKIDKDSNLPHIWLAFCELAFLVSYEAMIERNLLPISLDDMPKYEQQIENREKTCKDCFHYSPDKTLIDKCTGRVKICEYFQEI
jgi:hypothetical protein